MALRFETRPLPAVWPNGQRTPVDARRWGQFKATLAATMDLLEHELEQLGAVEPIVIEAGYEPHELRVDGRPRANARPRDPAVVLSFQSRFGPLRYACDTYATHDRNLRAIALALEALRAVDRYGVTRRGEQYQGWSALPPAGENGMSRAEAEAIIRHFGDPDGNLELRVAYRRAAKLLDRDRGGDPGEWKKLNRAAQVVGLA